jgi:hypothetical protein
MKTRFVFLLTLALALALPALSQERGERGGAPPAAAHPQERPRANQGKIPPAPTARTERAAPQVERTPQGKVNETPHVNHNTWYGHEAPNDARFHLDHPFEHGHFTRFGPSYRYNVVRIDPANHYFWLPDGFYFQVAAWDWAIAEDWCWDCGDDFVIYEDPDHPGWYLCYNVMTGQYVHVIYMGG